MARFAQYAVESGRIITMVDVLEDRADLYQAEGRDVIRYDGPLDDATGWVSGGEVIARPAVAPANVVSIAANGADEFVLADVPAGTTIMIDGEVHQVDDGEFVFTTFITGDYGVSILPPFPYQEQRIKVTAHAD